MDEFTQRRIDLRILRDIDAVFLRRALIIRKSISTEKLEARLLDDAMDNVKTTTLSNGKDYACYAVTGKVVFPLYSDEINDKGQG